VLWSGFPEDMPYSRWTPVALEYNPVLVGSIDGTDTIPHDRAIVRALNARYHPNKGVIGDPACTLFVGRLNYATTEYVIEKTFSAYGPVRRVRLVRDVVTGISRGYAFVEFFDVQTTRKACREATGLELDDKQLFIDYECERTLNGWVPRRLGGGFSGRKESGQLRFGGRDRPFRKPIIFPPVKDELYSSSFNQQFKQDIGEESSRFSDESEVGQRRQHDDRNEERVGKYINHSRDRFASRSRDGPRDSRASSRTESREHSRDREHTKPRVGNNKSRRSRSRSRHQSVEGSKEWKFKDY
jgi:U11/U12 small nuclear ribonucleoprotein SNRNP35